jgi:hypothetical protein
VELAAAVYRGFRQAYEDRGGGHARRQQGGDRGEKDRASQCSWAAVAMISSLRAAHGARIYQRLHRGDVERVVQLRSRRGRGS